MKDLNEYQTSPVLEYYRKVQILVILVALISTYLFLFIRLKFKVDITGVLSLLLFLIATIIRVIDYFSQKLNEEEEIFDIIQLECQILVWYSLYFFVIEMLKVKHKIESHCLSEARSKAKKDRICHKFLIVGLLAYMGLEAYILVIQYKDPTFF